jgi:hypothetical protein
MAAVHTPSYTISQIKGVLDAGLSFALSDVAVQNIVKLSEDMGLGTPSTTPRVVIPKLSTKQEDVFVRRKDPVSSIPKPTGIEAVIATIRLTMNKVTAKTVATAQETVIQLGENVAETSPENLGGVVSYLFEIMSGNKINSRPLADMMHAICTRFPAIKTMIDGHVADMPKKYEDIRYVDPDEDYDEYCVTNAQNQRRRAKSMFLVNLVRTGAYPVSIVIALLTTLLTTIHGQKEVEEKKFINNELIEHVEIMCVEDMLLREGEGGAQQIMASVRELEAIRGMRADQRPKGLSSKLMCSCINILERISPAG